MYQRWVPFSKSKVRAMRVILCFTVLCTVRFSISKHNRNPVLLSERIDRQESISFQSMRPKLQGETSAIYGALSRFCKTTPYRHSKLYGIANVQKGISSWKHRRIYLGSESRVPYRQRKSFQNCNLDMSNISENSLVREFLNLREKVLDRSQKLLFNFQIGATDYSISKHLLSELLSQDKNHCQRPVSFAFAISSQEGSGKLRGFMIADELNRQGHTAVTVFGKEGPAWPSPLKELQTCRELHVCIFVKWDSRSFPTILRECKKRGAAAFIDLLDYCDSNRKNIVDEWPKEIDGFILQSEFQLQYFKYLGYNNSLLIRHHHTNKNKRVQPRGSKLRAVGFTGSRKNAGGQIQDFLGEVELWCKMKEIKLVQIISNRLKIATTQNDIYDQRKYHTGEIDSIDIAIIWPKQFTDSEIYFKPITRFIYWLSHGIPTIVYPTQSYIEIAEDFDYPLVANSTSEVLDGSKFCFETKHFGNI